MADVRLDDLSFGDPEIDGAFRAWREAIERANTWAIGGHVEFSNSPSGFTLFVKGYPGPSTAVVATGGITARVSSTQLGVGNAVLRIKTPGKATVASGATVKVYSWFGTALTAGTHIEILPIGDGDYKLVAADCPA